MKNLVKWILRITIALVLLVVIAAFVLPLVIDPNDYKDTIQNKVKDQIGREIHLDGQIQWKVFPWLALTLNDVKLDNEKGFKGKSLAEIQKLTARVKIMPLLSKNIEIGRVALEDAQINLQITKKGNSNWQSILTNLEKGNSSDGSSNEGSSSGSLNIAGIDLKNINLNYTDLQSGTKAVVSQFNLATGEITQTSPVQLDTSMRLNMPDTGLDVDISANVLATNLLSGTGIKAELKDFIIKGKMSNGSIMPLEISLQKPGVIDLAKDTINIPELLIALGDAHIVTDVSGKNISKTSSQISGSYQISAFDLNEFLKKMTGAYFVTNDTFSDFSSSGQWAMGTNSMKLSGLKINYADTAIDGSANIKNLEKMQGDFKLHMNTFNVDAFMGTEETASNNQSTGSSATPDIDFGHLNGSLAIDKLLASGTTVENLKITVKTNGPKLVMSPIKADFYQGLLISAIKIDTKAQSNKVILEHNMNKVHAGPLLTDLAGSKLLTGLGDFNVDLKIDRPFSDIPLKTAHGNLKYTLTDGAIYGVDVFGMMQKGLSMLYPEVQEQSANSEKKTSFALMQIDANMDQGILTTNTLKLESPYLKVGGKLKIDLVNMTIDGTIEPMLLDIPEQLVSDKYKKLLNLAIPVTLSGSLLEPKISIDAKKLLLASQKERIDKEKDKLKGKLMDSLFGKDKSKEEGGKDPADKGQQKTEDSEPKEEKEPESDKDKIKKKLLKGIFG
jgi:AsmA protein